MVKNVRKNDCGGHALGIAFGITLFALVLLAGTASAANVAYVSAYDASKLYVVNLDTKSVVKTIDIPPPPSYNYCSDSQPGFNDLKVVDGKIFLSVPGSTEDYSCQIFQVKVINLDLGYIKTINISYDNGDQISKSLPSGLKVYNNKLYVLSWLWIQEIDPVNETTTRYIPVSIPDSLNYPHEMEIVDNKIYLPVLGNSVSSGEIQVINLTTGSVLKHIGFSKYGPLGIKQVSSHKIYLGGDHEVAVLDTTTDTIVKSFNYTRGSILAFATDLGKVYGATGDSNVAVIDLATDSIIKSSIDVGFHPHAEHRVDIAALGDRVYVTDTTGINIINATTDTYFGNITTTDLSSIEVVNISPNNSGLPIGACGFIISPGRYVLTADLSGSSTCIDITSKDVILDGAGHSITGENMGGSYGIYVHPYLTNTKPLTNVTVENLIVTNWDTGVYYNNTQKGRILYNNASNNRYGLRLESSGNNSLSGNTANFNNNYGIYISHSSNNLISNNYFNNTDNFFENSSANTWNIAKTEGINIIGGSYLGGNFWANPGGTGFSQICTGNSGICGSSYTLDSNNIDYLPLRIKSTPGFEAVFTIGGMLVVAYLLTKSLSHNKKER